MPLGIDFAQILLHLFNVVILFGGLYILLYAPVKKFMDQREEQYAKREKETADNLEASEAARIEYESRLSYVEYEISKEREEAAHALEEMKKKKELEARESSAAIIKKAETIAEQKRRKILRGIKNDIEDIVNIATEKVVLGEKQEENFDVFLDEVERSVANAK